MGRLSATASLGRVPVVALRVLWSHSNGENMGLVRVNASGSYRYNDHWAIDCGK